MWRSLSALLAVASLQVSAQSPAPQRRPAFEVATIKESQSPNDGGTLGMPPGRFIVRNGSLAMVVLFAYNLKGYELAELPDWMNTTRYVIDAKTEGVVPPAAVRQM